MKLRMVIKAICGVFLVAVLFATPLYAGNNILLIIADDFGVDSHDLYGIASSAAPTPTINSLAAQGVRFDRAWSNPVCSPTRATILTGRYSFRTGVGDAIVNHIIDSNEYTVGKALQSLGYSTAAIGKWHLGGPAPRFMGFDYYSGDLPWSGQLPDYFNWTKYESGVTSTVTTYATTENVNDAVEWINNQEILNPDKPWFMWLAFNAPHEPFHKPPNNLHSYDYLTGTDTDIGQNTVPYYQAMVEAMDTEIGRLLNTIDVPNTNIIFVGDNGTPPQAEVPPAIGSRVKGTLYQGGVWVPLIISGPAVTNINRSNGALVNTADLFATITEMAGGNVSYLVPNGTSIDSVSLLPLLNDSTQSELCQYVFTERFSATPAVTDGKAIRNNQYKLIRFDSGGERLHFMSNDPALYPIDEIENLLDRALSQIEQANYDELSNKLNSLLAGNDTDRICFIDSDGDGVPDNLDNCTLIPNLTQCDGDNDGYGNHCDSDFNNDLIVNGLDIGLFKAGFGTADPVTDLNCDGITNGLDVGLLKAMFGSPPGPSGLNP